MCARGVICYLFTTQSSDLSLDLVRAPPTSNHICLHTYVGYFVGSIAVRVALLVVCMYMFLQSPFKVHQVNDSAPKLK